MRKEYVLPEIELIKINLSKDVLNVSDPEGTLPSQGEVTGPGNIDDDF